jgi:hypothetical protein
MALTFRDNNGSPLSFTEMDSNFRYFTGSFENSGSITAASFTSSGNISASGNLFGDRAVITSYIQTPTVNSATNVVKIDDNLNVVGQITASGNVSSSAASTASFGTYLGDGSQLSGIGGGLWTGSAGKISRESDVEVTGSLTVNGNISSSGNMYSSMFRGEQLYINSGSSLVLNNPGAGDAALIAMSGSAAFSSIVAIQPNNLVLFSEYKTNDPAILDGKAASSIQLSVNHGNTNNKNSVAQIACVVKEFNSNNSDLVLSTRGADNVTRERVRIGDGFTSVTGSLDVSGALSKGSGTFKIAHPVSTGSLYHSFIEGPKCDLIYRGTTTLTNGVTDVNIDSVSNMTEGTFVALTQDPQLFLQNTNGWEPLKGSISGNILSIECKSTSSVDNVSWMVVAERADDFIKNWNLTDENGHLIPEQ